MKKRSMASLFAGLLFVTMLPGVTSAAQKTSCPSANSGWVLWDIHGDDGVAEYFFEHLLPEYGFQDPGEFADAIDAIYDKNRDDMVCAKEAWGADLNPKSHWYRFGMDALGEPIHVLMTRDNNANGS